MEGPTSAAHRSQNSPCFSKALANPADVGSINVLDDGRQEQSEAVDWAKASHADEHEDVYLPVLDGLPNILRVKVIRQVAVIFCKTAFDLLAFFRRQESSTVYVSLSNALLKNEEHLRRWVVVDAPVGYHADKDA
jgi:hypothetical protein